MAISAALLPILAIGAIGATVVGTGLAIASTMQQTSATVKADTYQAQIADRNTQIQAVNTSRAEARAQAEQQDRDRSSAAIIGAITANQSASGLSLGGRSAMLTRKSARELARIDALNVRQAGDLEAYNYKVASEDSASAATFARQRADSDQLAGWLSVGSSIIGGAGKLMSPIGNLTPKIGSAYTGGWGSSAFAG